MCFLPGTDLGEAVCIQGMDKLATPPAWNLGVGGWGMVFHAQRCNRGVGGWGMVFHAQRCNHVQSAQLADQEKAKSQGSMSQQPTPRNITVRHNENKAGAGR